MPWRQDGMPSAIVCCDVLYGPDPDGPGGLGFQVATGTIPSGSRMPTNSDLRAAHHLRQGHGTTPLVVAVTDGATAWLIGPSPDQPARTMPLDLACRQLQSVLDEPTTQAAYNRILRLSRTSDATMVSGVTNSGLFASYHLRVNAPSRADWPDATSRASAMIGERGERLIKALGYRSEPASGGTHLLFGATGRARAIAVLLDASEDFDANSPRYQLSPVAYGLGVAMNQEIDWLIALRGDQIRLYPGRDGIGVGQKGQAETFLELDLAALDTGYMALLPLVFSAEALSPGGTTQQLLDDSARFAAALGTRLRDRIYIEVVPPLAKAVAEALHADGRTLDTGGLADAYRVTLRILFRLLFQAYAEDRGLLPSGRNKHYDQHSLQTAAQRDADVAAEDFDSEATSLWLELAQVWNAIDQGNKLWQVPAYNGGLFTSDPQISPEGALLASIQLPDSVIGPVLQHLLVDDNDDGTRGPVDFRSLSVRDFGTIYEGLLESALSVAEQDLTTDSTGTWIPAKPHDTIEASAGSVYFHSASGERKATGSYFTPKFVVDHLIERSITPALTEHLAKVEALLIQGEEAAAERMFFDFRVADLAMGSGHFLVAAVDKIEALMRTFLTKHSLPGVQSELLRLETAANEALGADEVIKSEIDNVGLLRRQIARRCIYGLDINPMAVELARLAIWIHTFVPGLPMSNLDHNLVCANSLTGIGTVEEALDALQPHRMPNQASLFDAAINASLQSAGELLASMANAEEADKKQAVHAAEVLAEAKQAAEPARRIFDASVATRLGQVKTTAINDQEDVERLFACGDLSLIAALNPAHMPYLFPEVFLRDIPGFDVLIGNPPWEELVYEPIKFWTLHFPGLKGNTGSHQQELITGYAESHPNLVVEMESEKAAANTLRAVLAKGPFPGLETGNADLYKAFCWRYLHLTRRGGRFAMVLPRTATSALGSAQWRRAVLSEGTFASVASLLNSNRWVFDMEPRYAIALVVVDLGSNGDIALSGPFSNAKAFMDAESKAVTITKDQLLAWSNSASFPKLPSVSSLAAFMEMRKSPSLERHSNLQFIPVQGDFNQTTDAALWSVGDYSRELPVLKGASFELWNPDTGIIHGSASSTEIRNRSLAKLQRQVKIPSSAFYGMNPDQIIREDRLPYQRARIAFRDVARATDTRTCIAALVPPAVLTNKAPFLFNKTGNLCAEAFLLGVLCSIPLDWYARQFVELSLNFFILNSLPIPVYDPASLLVQRVIQIAGRLAAVDDRYIEWAAAVGVTTGSVADQNEKNDLVAELDALVSLLYGLTDDQVEHIFATFQRGWDYQARLEAVLNHYAYWKGRS